jgi:hypothetical protein
MSQFKIADLLQSVSVLSEVPGKDEIESKLKDFLGSYLLREQFEPGMLVQWKKGLKNRKVPEYNEPIIVLEALSTPVLDEGKNSGSPYFMESLDLVCGGVFEDKFIQFHYDSLRFEPYVDEKYDQ